MTGTVSIAAEALLTARRTGRTIAALPAGTEPQTLAEAYAIQDEISKSVSAIAGWKAGPFGSGEIVTAPLYQETFITGPSVSVAHLPFMLLEPELAFRLRAPVTPSMSAAALIDNLQFVPLYEIVGSRFGDITNIPPLSLFADTSASGFIKIGAIVERWQDIPADKQIFRMTVDGKQIAEFNYADKLKAGVELTLAVIRGKDGRSRDLPAGLIITTGSMTKPAPSTGEIVADYGALGVHKLIIQK